MAVRDPARNHDWYWDHSHNAVGGCRPVSPGCKGCYAARAAGTWLKDSPIPLHRMLYGGTTDRVRRRYAFNGRATSLPPAHSLWTEPFEWTGAPQPVLGAGMPSIVFIADMSDLFFEGHSIEIISRVVSTFAASAHIGLILTRRTQRAAEFFHSVERLRSAGVLRRWKGRIWIGFSAEDQEWFDIRWPHMRPLAERGWTLFCSIAPMIGPVRLPEDFLRLGAWAICSGEQGPAPRYMNTSWARRVRDQCAAAGIPFFMKQCSGKRPIPPDLHIRQFPKVAT